MLHCDGCYNSDNLFSRKGYSQTCDSDHDETHDGTQRGYQGLFSHLHVVFCLCDLREHNFSAETIHAVHMDALLGLSVKLGT